MERVLQTLKDLGRVPRDFARSQGRRPAIWALSRTTEALIGRERDIEKVLTSLQQHGAAVIWGGPGEGKTTIAMEAAARLRVEQPSLQAFELDMRGERAAVKVPSFKIGTSRPLLSPYRCFGAMAHRHGLNACLIDQMTAQMSRRWLSMTAMTPSSALRQG